MASAVKKDVNKVLMSFEVKGSIRIKKSDDMYVALFPSLNIASQGYTREEAKQMLADAIFSIITTSIERGTLIEYLKKHNYKVDIKFVKKDRKQLDTSILKSNIEKENFINVPIYLKSEIDKNSGLQKI